jgi:uncharacterized protein YjcR
LVSEYQKRNKDFFKAKGEIPLWVIADKLSCHENTVRNWLKKELVPEKKERLLGAINEIKQDLREVR